MRVLPEAAEGVAAPSLARSDALFRELLAVSPDALQDIVPDRRRTEELSGLEQSLLGILASRATVTDMYRQVPRADDIAVKASKQVWRLPAPAYSIASAVQRLARKLSIGKATDRGSSQAMSWPATEAAAIWPAQETRQAEALRRGLR